MGKEKSYNLVRINGKAKKLVDNNHCTIYKCSLLMASLCRNVLLLFRQIFSGNNDQWN